MYDEIHMNEMVWDGKGWRLESTWLDHQSTLEERTTRFVKRAPLGMMLTRDNGFRMVAP